MVREAMAHLTVDEANVSHLESSAMARIVNPRTRQREISSRCRRDRDDARRVGDMGVIPPFAERTR